MTLTYKGKLRNSDEARSFWSQHSRRQRKIEQHYLPKISAEIKKQINAFVHALDTHGYLYAKNNLETILNFEGVAKVIKSLYHKSAFIESNFVLNYMRRKKKQVNHEFELKRLGVDPKRLGLSFEELAPLIDQYFDIYLLNNSAIPITNYTKKMIRNFLIAKVDAGENLQVAIQNFKELAVSWTGRGGRADRRAKNIAISESTRAMSFGGLIGAYMSGVDCDKVWVTSNDEQVRGYYSHPHAKYPHTTLDLAVTSLRGSFYNGERIKFPGDPHASVENIAGCRCANYFREKAKPKPIVTRELRNFIVDVIQGFLIGELIGEVLND